MEPNVTGPILKYTFNGTNTSTERRKTASFPLVQRYTCSVLIWAQCACVCVCVQCFISHSASVFVLLPYCSAAQNSSTANCESAQQSYTTPDLKLSQGLLKWPIRKTIVTQDLHIYSMSQLLLFSGNDI